MVNTEHAAAVETLLAAVVLSAIGGHWVAITNAHVVIRGVLTELGPVRMSCRCGEQSCCAAAGQQTESEAVGNEYLCE